MFMRGGQTNGRWKLGREDEVGDVLCSPGIRSRAIHRSHPARCTLPGGGYERSGDLAEADAVPEIGRAHV